MQRKGLGLVLTVSLVLSVLILSLVFASAFWPFDLFKPKVTGNVIDENNPILISACGTYSASDTYYKITQDLVGQTRCLIFLHDVNNIIVDGQGHSINSPNVNSYGIELNSNVKNVLIKDLTVKSSGNGIDMASGSSNIVLNHVSLLNNKIGLSTTSITNITVVNSVFTGNTNCQARDGSTCYYSNSDWMPSSSPSEIHFLDLYCGTQSGCTQCRFKSSIVKEALGTQTASAIDVLTLECYWKTAGNGGSRKIACPAGVTGYDFCVENNNDGVGNHIVLGVKLTSSTSSSGGGGSNPTCTDSDGGLNYYIKGTTNGLFGYETTAKDYSDYCGDTNSLIEFSCSSETPSRVMRSLIYICPNGCSDGACLPQSVDTLKIVSVSPSDGSEGTYSGQLPVDLPLTVYTSKNASCKFASGDSTQYVLFYNTFSTKHQQSFSFSESGSKKISIACATSTGETATAQTTFKVNLANSNPTCTDSDGGKNYYTKGKVTLNDLSFGINGAKEDVCVGDTVVGEYYCLNSSTYGGSISYTCPNGCSDGACINTTVTPSCKNPIYQTVATSGVCSVDFSRFGQTQQVMGSCVTPVYETTESISQVSCSASPQGPNAWSCSKCSCQVWATSQNTYVRCNDTSQAPSCTDTDGGKEIYTKGTLTSVADGIITTKTDSCTGGVDPNSGLYQITEYSCPEVGAFTAGIYNCPNGCSNGACIAGLYPGFFMSTDKSTYLSDESVMLKIVRADNQNGSTSVNLYIVSQDINNKRQINTDYPIKFEYDTSVNIDLTRYSDIINAAGDYLLLLCDAQTGCIDGHTNSISINIAKVNKCTPKIMCVISPNICPASGVQIKECQDIENCQGPTTSSRTSEEIKCNPGECSGCELDSKCIPYGFRIQVNLFNNNPGTFNTYCDITGKLELQKVKESNGNWAKCQNNYECDSNVCSSGECIEVAGMLKQAGAFKGTFVRVVCRLSHLFNQDNYNTCINNYLGTSAASSSSNGGGSSAAGK
ncbi:MAG: hypothetical protein WCK90_02540 [archaeon]